MKICPLPRDVLLSMSATVIQRRYPAGGERLYHLSTIRRWQVDAYRQALAETRALLLQQGQIRARDLQRLETTARIDDLARRLDILADQL